MDASLLNLVIAKKLGKDKVKVAPGKYHLKGHVLLQIDAEVTKGEEESYCPTAKLPLKEVLATFVKRYKIKQSDLEELLVEAYNNAKENCVSIKDELVFTEFSLSKVEKVLGKLPPEKRDGKTNLNGFVRLVEDSSHVDISTI